jgi:hypothetical protein
MGCSGRIDAMVSTLNCPNLVPYGGDVVVEDGDGNLSTQASFTIGVCDSSSVMP